MFGQLEIFQLAQARAVHASARQAEIAANIANADTPGYRATDIHSFEESYRAGGAQDFVGGLRATRAGHYFPGERHTSELDLDVIDRPTGGSPNGNTVSVEMEMLESIEADRTHNRAITIYETALGILRTSMRSGR